MTVYGSFIAPSLQIPHHGESPMATIHCVGIGGIGVSALAKWLLVLGYQVTGSDAVENAQVEVLRAKGIPVVIGADPAHVGADVDLLVYSSAIPDTHPERVEARRRGIAEMNSFALLGELVRERDVAMVAGTHGKSTTTALLSLMLSEAGLDPTCFVGSVVPGFPEGNLRIGTSSLVVIEGDEYDRHFLYFSPRFLVLHALEWDHTDQFPTFEAMVSVYRQLLHQVRDNGVICANADDPRVVEFISAERAWCERRGITVRTYGLSAHADTRVRDLVVRDGAQHLVIQEVDDRLTRTKLHIPGKMNVSNTLAAFACARVFAVDAPRLARTIERFPGIWRRFERVKEQNGILVISDYAHHPTAIRLTLEAAKSFYPGRRIVCCFEPHRQERTRDLFWEFVPAFDLADVVVLVEVWDMPNREPVRGEAVSSAQLVDAIREQDRARGRSRIVDYASTKEAALAQLQVIKKPGDLILIAGAGSIYTVAAQV